VLKVSGKEEIRLEKHEIKDYRWIAINELIKGNMKGVREFDQFAVCRVHLLGCIDSYE